MFTYKQNQIVSPLLFRMVLAADHITAATGLSPAVTLSKNGGAFAAAVGTVVEVGLGWYKVTPNATDFNTIGPLLLNATAATADVAVETFQVNSGLVDLGPTQLTDIVGNVQGSVGSVLSSVTCKCKCKKCC